MRNICAAALIFAIMTTSAAWGRTVCTDDISEDALLLAVLIAAPICVPLAVIHAVFPRSVSCNWSALKPTTTCREVSDAALAAENQQKIETLGLLLQYQQLQAQERAAAAPSIPRTTTTTCRPIPMTNEMRCTAD